MQTEQNHLKKQNKKTNHKIKWNFQNKSTSSAGAGLLNYITFFVLSLFYAVKSFIVIPVHCWVATSTRWLVCQAEVLWRRMSQTPGDGFVISASEETPSRRGKSGWRKTKRKRRKNSGRSEQRLRSCLWWTAAAGEREKRGGAASVTVVLNINISTWRPVLTNNTALQLQPWWNIQLIC